MTDLYENPEVGFSLAKNIKEIVYLRVFLSV